MNNSIHAPGASWETIKASFYFYLPHSDDAYDEVLEALDAAGYKRPDEDGYLGGVK